MTKITQTPDGTITFDLVFPKATIASEYQHVLLEVGKTAQIKGFRPGKAPLKMVEAQTDKSKLYSHVLEHLLSPAYSAVIHEHKLVPLIDPKVTPKGMEVEKDWTLAVEVAVSPVVELGAYEKYVKIATSKLKKDHKPDDKLNAIFDSLLAGAKLAVSPLLIEEETKSALSRLANQLTSLKLSVADYAKSVKKTTEELIAEYKKSAESNLKLEFILLEIAKEHNFLGKESRKQTLDFLSAL